ncbi:unnamed protein product [Euphydryas editha]|uniref:Peptidase S1 domain-containing protein n=1 Tax=Euphydryas editha TaxID=104508 RepID=A0AAU9TXS5_EUPED|nr:unnamed protein product [Euphydryas editha]
MWCKLFFVVVLRFVVSEIIFSEKVQIPTGNYLNDEVQVDSRIIGGEETEILEHPYQVSFIVNNSYFCGGFIVSENYILTAAHCAQKKYIGYNLNLLSVCLWSGFHEKTTGQVQPLCLSMDKDVAVLKTEKPIEFIDTIQPIALPPKNRQVKGEFIVSGWGRTEYESFPERLMSVKLRVVNFDRCFAIYGTILTKNMWCGGNFFLGGTGTGQGDSGGAAIQDGMAMGIVSFNRAYGQAFSPSVFANIAAPAIRDFISNNTGL